MSVQMRAVEVLQAVLAGTSLTLALDEALKDQELTPSDKAALRDISYGTQRYRSSLKFFLDSLLSKSLSVPQIENLLLIALYQLSYSKNASYAVVNNAVKEAANIAQGRFKNLVNGVLRNFLRRTDELKEKARTDKNISANHQLWWINRLEQDYPNKWQSIIDAGNSHPPFTLRINRRKNTQDEYLQLLAKANIEVRVLDENALQLIRPISVDILPGFKEGLISVQDFGAQKAAHLLDLQVSNRVLDACSAPGGKSCHILELCDVDLTALDIDTKRLRLLQNNLQRLDLSAKTIVSDAANIEKWWDGELFQRILADVPCTASGVVRRHPDIKWLRQPYDAKKFAKAQSPLLDALWQTLAYDGKMLYATCSIFSEENRLQVDDFLSRHCDAVLIYDEQLLPNENHDGFYYALLEKHL